MEIDKRLERYKVTSADLALKQNPVQGWLHPTNAEVMLPYIQKASTIVELGTWYGKSACWFAENSTTIVSFIFYVLKFFNIHWFPC